MTEKRFILKSIHFHKLTIDVYDKEKEKDLHLSIFELVELLNEVSAEKNQFEEIIFHDTNGQTIRLYHLNTLASK